MNGKQKKTYDQEAYNEMLKATSNQKYTKITKDTISNTLNW